MVCAAAPPPKCDVIQELNIVHFSHTDIGFTDNPAVCRELFRRYVDVAVDTVLDSLKGPAAERFFWTAESTMPVADWWQAASPARRRQLVKALRSGQLEISALACNNTPFMNAAQWQTMVHWLPEELWKEARPQVAIQNDVNGLPRAAALALLDRGVRYLFTGINSDSGGPPFPRPAAFWWKMPDGRRVFVWLNEGYGSGFDLFEPGEWRRGPVPSAADTTYRPPRAGDMLRDDEASVRRAHQQCVERLRQVERSGYQHPVLTISLTSQWRFDNDPPFAPLARFAAEWNRLGFEPRLRLTTVTDAMKRLEQAMGATAPEYTGEWTDWWANGTASAPREVAASRAAKRLLADAESPLWGPADRATRRTADALYRDLCLFDEHTWGSSLSVARPYSLDTQGQFAEKAILAYRPMARAEWLLSQRARTRLLREGEGFYLANPGKAAFSGWVRLVATCLRDSYQSLEDPSTGARLKLHFEPGIQPWGRPQKPEDLSREDISATFPDRAPNQVAKFWVERLEGNSWRRLRLSKEPVGSEQPAGSQTPEIATDPLGWPKSARWPGMTKSLFLEGFGDLSMVEVKGFAPRHLLADIRGRQGAERERMRREILQETRASAEKVAVQESPHTLLFTQPLNHSRLQWGTRVLELWKREPRARFTLRVNRLSSALPEILYADFPLPTGDALPAMSSGGQAFTPFTDQIPGTCRDYFAMDSWVDYTTPDGSWLWVSRDVPLVALGASPTLALRQTAPADPHRLRAMLFNNFWYTNFAADEHGIVEYQFDLVWRRDTGGPVADAASALLAQPVVLINPNLPEDPRMMKYLYQP
jgi:post-segregation antitoxin (ccd killing protein)